MGKKKNKKNTKHVVVSTWPDDDNDLRSHFFTGAYGAVWFFDNGWRWRTRGGWVSPRKYKTPSSDGPWTMV